MNKLKIHYFQHVPFEGLAVIEHWIKERGHELSATHFYQPFTLPSTAEVDWLIVMGGPMGVYDEAVYPWLKEEKDFIKKIIAENKPVLGICLGAQLIAEVIGGKVYKNKQKEIGFFPVSFLKEAKESPLFSFMPSQMTVFHWHGDTFDLPEGAVNIASSVVTKNQAFVYKEKVVGLQFHFEVDEKAVMEMTTDAGDELVKDAYVQTADEIRERVSLCEENNKLMFGLLERMEGVEGG